MTQPSQIGSAERALEKERSSPKGLDRNVKVLGLVSLLNDFSSEVTVRTLPLFLANVLGVGTGIIGFIEGVAESTASLLKIASGYFADRLQKRKALPVWGYGLSGFTTSGPGIRVAEYCLVISQWRLPLWPRGDRQRSEVMLPVT